MYIPQDTAATGEIVVGGDEAHHALHVVRVRPGDPVALFDGHGREISGEVVTAGKREVVVQALEERVLPPPPRRLTLLQAWLHRDKALDFIVQHGTELGVARFVFFRAQRSERKPVHSDKWTRTAIEACKQCGRIWLPEFILADGIEEAVRNAAAPVLLATKDLHAAPLRTALGGGSVALMVGPEGDFTDEEIAAALEAGVTPICLGAATYRSEMAAIAGATLIQYELGELGPIPHPGRA
ncbi:MAG TPA: RsmE family RNA methyltransferase [Candidatus Bathyarchaeia archaeon]|nr:RsmE family RNA methyltransferase [Candidatus Bathyarchaeia archaeon]